MSELTGWAPWKGDSLASVDLNESKRGVLIGYDLIPLRGLDNCEAHLAAGGIHVLPTRVVSVAEGDLYAPTVRGELVPAMLAWSCCSESPDVALQTTAGYLAAASEDDGTRACGDARACGVTLSEAEVYDLKWFWWSLPLRTDKRRRSTLAKLTARVEAILAREQVAIVPVRFERPEPVEVA